MSSLTEQQLIQLITLRYTDAPQAIKDAILITYKKLTVEELELTSEEILVLNTGLN
jgi:hypothetical protein